MPIISRINMENNLTKTEELEQIAEDNGICIDNDCPAEISAMSVCLPCGIKVIGLNREDWQTVPERLAHEVGHCLTDGFYPIGAMRSNRWKAEYQANKWAILHLIPFDSLEEAVEDGNLELWQLAEYFSVSQAFVQSAIDYYALHGLTIERKEF